MKLMHMHVYELVPMSAVRGWKLLRFGTGDNPSGSSYKVVITFLNVFIMTSISKCLVCF